MDSVLKLHPTNSMVLSWHLHTRTNFKHVTRCTSTYTQNTNKANFNIKYAVSKFHIIAGCHTHVKSPKFFANQQHSTTKYKHTAIAKHKYTIITNSVCSTPEQSHSHYKTQPWNHHLAPHHLPQCHPKQPCQLPLEDPQESNVPHQKLHTAIWQLLASHSLSVRREALRKAKEAAKKGHPSKMAFTMIAKLLPAIFT